MFYIGSAKNLDKRYKKPYNWSKHQNKDLRHDALNGDKFMFCIIQECNSRSEAYCMEQWWLDFYAMNDLWGCLYNRNKYVYKFRCDNTGLKHSQEAKDKIRVAHTGKKRSQTAKDNMRIAQTGKKASYEAKAKNSAAHIGKKKSQETKDKMSAAQKETQNRPEIKAAKSISQKIIQNRPEVKERQRAAQTGKKASQDAKDKMSAAHQGNKNSNFRHDITFEKIHALQTTGMTASEIMKTLKCSSYIFYSRLTH